MSRWHLALAAAAALFLGWGGAGTLRAPAPASLAPAFPVATVGDPDTCRGCHPVEWQEWRDSRHAAAWRDPVFQAEFERGRPAWCVGCHAPEAPDPTAASDADPRVTRGVGCAGCHVRDGRLVSTRRAPGSPHDTVVDPSLGSPEQCASCHEFNFPILGERGRLVRYTDEPMQSTVSEFRRSGLAGIDGCADCHASSPGGHRFPGSHDVAMVQRAVELTLCRDGGALAARIRNSGAGHAVPSGGVHRHMVVRAWRPGAPERLAEHRLGRRFRPLVGGGKEAVSDTTLAVGESRRLRFDLADLGGAGPVHLELRYVYALDERADLPADDVSQVILRRRVDPSALPACL